MYVLLELSAIVIVNIHITLGIMEEMAMRNY